MQSPGCKILEKRGLTIPKIIILGIVIIIIKNNGKKSVKTIKNTDIFYPDVYHPLISVL